MLAGRGDNGRVRSPTQGTSQEVQKGSAQILTDIEKKLERMQATGSAEADIIDGLQHIVAELRGELLGLSA